MSGLLSGAFIGGGILSGVGAGLAAQLAQQGLLERDQARSQLQRDTELAVGQQAGDIQARNQAAVEAQRAQDEQTLEQQREASAEKIAQRHLDAEAPLRQAQADEATNRGRYFKAFADATSSGTRWSGRGAAAGTEFERLTTRLATLPQDDDLRPVIEQRLQKLAGSMSPDQRAATASHAAQADAQLQRDNYSGDPAGLDAYRAKRFDYWSRLFGAGAVPPKGNTAPVGPTPPATTGSKTPRAAPAQGTQANPYRPVTNDDFARIPSGGVYINPADGQLYTKN